MAYLRGLSQEFHALAEWGPNTFLTMPYLATMERQQSYLDGILDPLFVYAGRGGSNANRLNGMRYFAADIPADATEAQRQAARGMIASFSAIWKVNFFRSVAEFLDAAVFEQLPKPVTDDEAIQERWAKESVPLIEKAHDAVFWFAAKGDGLLGIEHHVGPGMSVKPIPIAYDPQWWIPFVNLTDRNLITGHTIMREWHDGPRLAGTTLANRIRIDHIVSEEEAANSDGVIRGPVRTATDYTWTGFAQGNLGSVVNGPMESRIQKIWRFGRSDSIFVDMEDTAFEAMMALTFLRAVLLRHPFPPVILPDEVSPFNLDANNRFTMDMYDPVVLTSSLKDGSARAYDYANNPAPAIAAACRVWLDSALESLAYAAHTPREAFGIPMGGRQESGEAIGKLQQIFKTLVVYIRRNLKDIFREQWIMMGGPDIEIDWESEPFAHGAARRAEIREDHVAGIISATTAQNLLGYPIDESMDEMAAMAAMPAGMMNGNSRAIEQGGNDMERGERTDG